MFVYGTKHSVNVRVKFSHTITSFVVFHIKSLAFLALRWFIYHEDENVSLNVHFLYRWEFRHGSTHAIDGFQCDW